MAGPPQLASVGSIHQGEAAGLCWAALESNCHGKDWVICTCLTTWERDKGLQKKQRPHGMKSEPSPGRGKLGGPGFPMRPGPRKGLWERGSGAAQRLYSGQRPGVLSRDTIQVGWPWLWLCCF